MTDATTVLLGVLAAIVVLAILFALAIGIAWILRERRRRGAYERAGVTHLDLYFDEHFPDIVRNFDLVSNARFDAWSNTMSSRLATLSRDLDMLGKARRGLDSRLDKLEKRIGDVE